MSSCVARLLNRLSLYNERPIGKNYDPNSKENNLVATDETRWQSLLFPTGKAMVDVLLDLIATTAHTFRNINASYILI